MVVLQSSVALDVQQIALTKSVIIQDKAILMIEAALRTILAITSPSLAHQQELAQTKVLQCAQSLVCQEITRGIPRHMLPSRIASIVTFHAAHVIHLNLSRVTLKSEEFQKINKLTKSMSVRLRSTS